MTISINHTWCSLKGIPVTSELSRHANSGGSWEPSSKKEFELQESFQDFLWQKNVNQEKISIKKIKKKVL
jgi:hypothetical protein